MCIMHFSPKLNLPEVRKSTCNHTIMISSISVYLFRSDECAKRCSEEIFSTLRVGSNFVIAFLLGFINYLLHSVIRKLLCGLLLICLDSIYKPLVQICFNGCCWPLLSLSSQLSKGCVVVLTPLLDLLGRVIVMVTNCVAACRLVQVNNNHKHYSTTA